MIEFYDVKRKSKVEVPESEVKKYTFQTKGGTRYGLKAHHEGSNLTKFIGKSAYESLNVPAG